MRYFQLDQSQVKIDHCSLSRFALVLHDNGEWTLSLRADQNPETEGQPRNEITAPGGALPDDGKQTLQLRRNLFFVRIRCYAAFPLDVKLPKQGPGFPALIELCPEPFWVQRGRPYDLRVRRPQPDVNRFFDLIDRVEVDFYYR
jgi:hypothetical protein